MATTTNNHYPDKYFEKKFMAIIDFLGTFKIKVVESYLMMPYYKIKLTCKTERFAYETIVIGDECEDEKEARENAFRKAYYALLGKYKKDIEEIEKSRRRMQKLED